MLAWVAGALALLLGAAAGAGAAARPDLKVQAVSAPVKSATIGSRLTIGATTRNAGGRRANRSKTALYLSLDRRRDRTDRLIGSSQIAALGARKSARNKIRARVPAGTPPGRYFQLLCADASRKAKESSERNNCKTARSILAIRTSPGPTGPIGPPGRVANPTLDDDGDGFANAKDCGPKDPAVNPNAGDLPDVPGFKDTNCDGVDGNASRAIFVAPTGNDTGPISGTRGLPKRTLAGAISAARAQGKDVYAAGAFAERLDVASGVSVYGGYAADWSRSLTSETKITGTQTGNRVESALALGTTAPTTLQLLRLAPRAATGSAASSYGLRAAGSPGLVIEYVTVTAGVGTAGTAGTAGANGRPGGRGGTGQVGNYNGSSGGQGGGPGASPVGRPGGRGGSGVYGAAGRSGDPGFALHGGGRGGAGGAAGDPGGPGAHGEIGEFGARGAEGRGGRSGSVIGGTWASAAGENGANGTDGHGGGGGGGGGGQTGAFVQNGTGNGGGGGGGGGEGGKLGRAGIGGGGSFGIFLIDSTGATVKNSVVTAANGGAGGAGGAGGRFGAGGARGYGGQRDDGEVGAGGNGAIGGAGGFGGGGGGGAGGPSIGLYLIDTTVTQSANTLRASSGGRGGPGGGLSGTAGVAAPQLTG